ncbi:MAG: hypothetical protein ACN6OP_18790 [Pseudomonadales bacterium]|uniref:hypothetical protein n=1 Tax=Delftia lacustris TaxID=558537 RepID=UPI0012E260E8|nr:hypothetical protein [Delftia lacustris]
MAYIEAIKRTGFVLENYLAEILKKEGWTVISNKYYEDDHSNTVREVDLIAYRTSKIQHFDVYTTLIISCKKNEECSWALLARDTNEKDPNVNWWPLHIWTNDTVLNHQISQKDASKIFHTYAKSQGVTEALNLPEFEVFAFQEVTKPSLSGKAHNVYKSSPKNDSAIFSSITSLIKAQAYELGSLSSRKKSPSVYQFNLISVAETDLLRILFKNNEITCEEISTEHYINRYIINRQETFSRIRFIKNDAFSQKLKDYENLHKSNCSWLNNQCNSYYDQVFIDYRRYNVLLPMFRKELAFFFKHIVKHEVGFSVNENDLTFTYDKENEILQLSLYIEDYQIARLNSSQKIKDYIAMKLKAIYRYSGDFEFSNDVPF